MGAVVLGLSAYAGYRTYDAYAKVSESDLLLANAEALADETKEGGDRSCVSGGWHSTSCSIEKGTTIVNVGISTGCSVSCESGYYACCGIKCTCKKQ